MHKKSQKTGSLKTLKTQSVIGQNKRHKNYVSFGGYWNNRDKVRKKSHWQVRFHKFGTNCNEAKLLTLGCTSREAQSRS